MRERERERDGDRERQTERERQTDRQRHTERERERRTGKPGSQTGKSPEGLDKEKRPKENYRDRQENWP